MCILDVLINNVILHIKTFQYPRILICVIHIWGGDNPSIKKKLEKKNPVYSSIAFIRINFYNLVLSRQTYSAALVNLNISRATKYILYFFYDKKIILKNYKFFCPTAAAAL